jgi:hypothetical protein
MPRHVFSILVLAVAASVGFGSARADLVLTDSGNIGVFQATNTGVSGGTATIVFAIPNVAAQMNSVNGVFITPEPTAVNGPVTMQVTPTGLGTYSLGLVPPTYRQTIGATPATQALLNFNLQTGVAPVLLPDFFNVAGQVTSLGANSNPNFDFSRFGPGGSINITFTATSITGATTFAGFLATPGAVATGNGSFSEAAVPEPGPLILCCVGVALAGVFRRRIVRRRQVAI